MAGEFEHLETLKHDAFGKVMRGTYRTPDGDASLAVARDPCAGTWFFRWIARYLARRERRVLEHLTGLEQVPQVLGHIGTLTVRSWIDGRPLHHSQPQPLYFEQARRLLTRVHRRSCTHNDLAKEPNLLVTSNGEPAFVDFQLASHHRRRSRWFRMLAREDLRHLLKHKRHYYSNLLRPRERAILARRSCLASTWMRFGNRCTSS